MYDCKWSEYKQEKGMEDTFELILAKQINLFSWFASYCKCNF